MKQRDAVNPLVSIIIPVYNGANYMREAIDSALAQTYAFVEVLVINDGAKDYGKTEEIALSYGNKIRYFSKENGGVATALNLGINEMKGEYFSWLSHDDIYARDKIEKQIAFLNSLNEKEVVVYSGQIIIDSESNFQQNAGLEIIPPEHFIFKYMMEDSFVGGCTLLIPKKIFDDIGYFNTNLRSTQDYEMWFRIAKRYDFICIPEPLVLSRHHMEQAVNITKTTLHIEHQELFIYMLRNFSPDSINDLKLFNHPVFFYHHIAIVFRRRQMHNVTLFAEKLLKKQFVNIVFTGNIKLILIAFKNIFIYVFDFYIKNTFIFKPLNYARRFKKYLRSICSY